MDKKQEGLTVFPEYIAQCVGNLSQCTIVLNPGNNRRHQVGSISCCFPYSVEAYFNSVMVPFFAVRFQFVGLRLLDAIIDSEHRDLV
jgi:hypothetical protein